VVVRLDRRQAAALAFPGLQFLGLAAHARGPAMQVILAHRGPQAEGTGSEREQRDVAIGHASLLSGSAASAHPERVASGMPRTSFWAQ